MRVLVVALVLLASCGTTDRRPRPAPNAAVTVEGVGETVAARLVEECPPLDACRAVGGAAPEAVALPPGGFAIMHVRGGAGVVGYRVRAGRRVLAAGDARGAGEAWKLRMPIGLYGRDVVLDLTISPLRTDSGHRRYRVRVRPAGIIE